MKHTFLILIKIILKIIADKTGTFSFACSVQCGIGHNGMSGKLVVK